MIEISPKRRGGVHQVEYVGKGTTGIGNDESKGEEVDRKMK